MNAYIAKYINPKNAIIAAPWLWLLVFLYYRLYLF